MHSPSSHSPFCYRCYRFQMQQAPNMWSVLRGSCQDGEIPTVTTEFDFDWPEVSGLTTCLQVCCLPLAQHIDRSSYLEVHSRAITKGLPCMLTCPACWHCYLSFQCLRCGMHTYAHLSMHNCHFLYINANSVTLHVSRMQGNEDPPVVPSRLPSRAQLPGARRGCVQWQPIQHYVTEQPSSPTA